MGSYVSSFGFELLFQSHSIALPKELCQFSLFGDWWKMKRLIKVNLVSFCRMNHNCLTQLVSVKLIVFLLKPQDTSYVSTDNSQTETWKLGSRIRRSSHCSPWHGHVMSQLWCCDLSPVILHFKIDLDLQSGLEFDINVNMVISLFMRSQFEMFSNLNVMCTGDVNGQFLVATTAGSMNIL